MLKSDLLTSCSNYIEFEETNESKGREDKESRNLAPSSLEALQNRVIDLESALEKKDDLVSQLKRELDLSQKAREEKDLELQQVSHNLLPLVESLQKMQQQLDEREQHQERDREAVELQFSQLLHELDSAREAILAKNQEISLLQSENKHLRETIESRKLGATANIAGEDEETVDTVVEEDLEEEEEETIGEAAGPPNMRSDEVSPRKIDESSTRISSESAGEDHSGTTAAKDPLDNFKEELEREYRKINESLQSAEQFSAMFNLRTRELTSNIFRIKEVRELERNKTKNESILGNEPKKSEEEEKDDGFDKKVKSWPREMVEKQLQHYRDAFNSERKSLEEMEDEKLKLEEELMSARLELEQKQLEVEILQSGKEQLEQYVAQLAEEMEKETSQMVSMKEQFQVETLKFNDFSSYLTSDDDDEAGSTLVSPAASPIAVSSQGEGGTSVRSISHRRSLPYDSPLTNILASAMAKGKERTTPRGRSKVMISISDIGPSPSQSREDLYSEDEEREGDENYREEVLQLREELRTVREELQRAREERDRKGTELQEQLAERDGKITLLEDELRKRNGEDQSSKSEINVLKKELFFSLAVAIKLNLSLQGRKCNVSITALYEIASGLQKHHSEWSQWIFEQLSAAEARRTK
jgi:chromosome segregation ATPase